MAWRTWVIPMSAVLVASLGASAQSTLQPTPSPPAGAQNESWYVAGEPIPFAGQLYYPTGAKVFFNRFEMVRTGEYRGIPLYVKPALEPYSILFVPVAGEVMQPYERRRTGELAGTVGTTTSSFPVVHPSELDLDRPVLPVSTLGREPAAGEAANERRTGPTPPLSAGVPTGINTVFIEFDGRRWFSAGPAIPFDPARFRRVGEHRGFAVYTSGPDDTIYIQVSGDSTALVAPYTLRR